MHPAQLEYRRALLPSLPSAPLRVRRRPYSLALVLLPSPRHYEAQDAIEDAIAFYSMSECYNNAIRLAKEDNSRDLSIGIRYMLDPNSMSLTLPSGAAYDLVDDDADSKPPAKDPMMSMMFEAMKKSYPQTDDES